jgi:anti-anti-sigma regulatory factor
MPLNIIKNPLSDDYTIEMIGTVDEGTDFPTEKLRLSQRVVFDCEKLNHINSYGLQKWSIWMKSVDERQQFVLKSVRPRIVNMLNRIYQLLPKEHIVESFYVPYECEQCGHAEDQLVRRGREYIEAHNGQPAKLLLPVEINCDKCKSVMKTDIWPEHYLKFLQAE